MPARRYLTEISFFAARWREDTGIAQPAPASPIARKERLCRPVGSSQLPAGRRSRRRLPGSPVVGLGGARPINAAEIVSAVRLDYGVGVDGGGEAGPR